MPDLRMPLGVKGATPSASDASAVPPKKQKKSFAAIYSAMELEQARLLAVPDFGPDVPEPLDHNLGSPTAPGPSLAAAQPEAAATVGSTCWEGADSAPGSPVWYSEQPRVLVQQDAAHVPTDMVALVNARDGTIEAVGEADVAISAAPAPVLAAAADLPPNTGAFEPQASRAPPSSRGPLQSRLAHECALSPPQFRLPSLVQTANRADPQQPRPYDDSVNSCIFDELFACSSQIRESQTAAVSEVAGLAQNDEPEASLADHSPAKCTLTTEGASQPATPQLPAGPLRADTEVADDAACVICGLEARPGADWLCAGCERKQEEGYETLLEGHEEPTAAPTRKSESVSDQLALLQGSWHDDAGCVDIVGEEVHFGPVGAGLPRPLAALLAKGGSWWCASWQLSIDAGTLRFANRLWTPQSTAGATLGLHVVDWKALQGRWRAFGAISDYNSDVEISANGNGATVAIAPLSGESFEMEVLGALKSAREVSWTMERWELDQPASSLGLLVWRSGGPGAAIAWVRTQDAYIDVEELEQRARQAGDGLSALADDTISEEPPPAREGRCRKRLKLTTEKQPVDSNVARTVRTSVPEQQAANCDAAIAPTTADGTGQQRMRGRPRAAKGDLGKPTSGGQLELQPAAPHLSCKLPSYNGAKKAPSGPVASSAKVAPVRKPAAETSQPESDLHVIAESSVDAKHRQSLLLNSQVLRVARASFRRPGPVFRIWRVRCAPDHRSSISSLL